jgi:pimeloyl-ACP methyl ester carboxylesterase
MILLSLTRFFAAVASAAMLVGAGYLLWTGYEGDEVRSASGLLGQAHEAWRLWCGIALLAWSLLGRLVMPALLASEGGRDPGAGYGEGARMAGASGSTLYVERHGKAGAPIILFTHGWGMDLTFWTYAKQDLADRFGLVLWDLPGLGRSRLPGDGKVAIARFAADLAGILQSLDRPVILVGHSIGGMTIQTLVRDHPEVLDRVAGVVLLNTSYTNPLKTMILSRLLLAMERPLLKPAMHLTIWLQPLVWLSKWQSYQSGAVHLGMRAGFGKYVTRRDLRHAALLAARAPPAVEAKGNLAMFDWDATGAMGRFPKPLLVVAGDKDVVTKPEASRTITAETPSAQLLVVTDANHMGPLERAELYNEAIARFATAIHRPGLRGAA